MSTNLFSSDFAQNLLFGRRRVRLFDIAIIDVLGTFVIAKVISDRFSIPFATTAALVFAAGIGVHELFGVNTRLNELVLQKS
jgi:hypothetical protein